MRIINILILLLTSNMALAASDNIFESVTLGFKVTKPNDWSFLTANENYENLKNIQLSDSNRKETLLKAASAPLVVIVKHGGETFDDVNPTLRVAIKLLSRVNNPDPIKILRSLLPEFKKMFNDFKLVQKPINTKVSELDAAYARFDYTLSLADGRVFPTASEFWIVPRGEYFFVFAAGTRQDENTGNRAEIYDILNSVVITQ